MRAKIGMQGYALMPEPKTPFDFARQVVRDQPNLPPDTEVIVVEDILGYKTKRSRQQTIIRTEELARYKVRELR